MVSRGGATFLVVVICVLSTVSATLEDGRPRPKNFPDQPTETYDNTPALADNNGLSVNCVWYGFANELFDAATGISCLSVLRKALSNATVNPPSKMKPYVYYTLKRLIDTANNESYCYNGCFNLGASLAPAPLATDAPSPLTSATSPSGSLGPVPSIAPGASSTPLGASPPAPATPVGTNTGAGAFLQPAILYSLLVTTVALFVSFATV